MCGDDFTWDKDHYYGTRSSDFMIDHLRTFQIVTNDDRWNNVINETYHVINTIQTHESLSTGLLPDFIYHCDTIPMPVWNEKKPAYLETEWDGAYFWNACRFPWRLGTDYLVSGDTRSLNALNKINAWIEKETEGNPDNICEGYKLDGTCLDKFEGHASIAFVATFAVSAMADARYQSWLNTLWSYTLAHGDQPNQYYDDTIKMICLIVMSGNWWQPSYQRIESIAKTK